MKRNKTPLSHYLRNYDVKFGNSIDDMWEEFDVNQNGFLERNEAKNFIDKLSKFISNDRAKFYDKHKFDQLFDEFDADRNGLLSKGEFAQFIKINFRQNEVIDLRS